MHALFRRAARLFSTLNKESLEKLSQNLQRHPRLQVLRPHITAENTPMLYHLVVRSKLNPQERKEALIELDKVARLQTELELNISANIKKQLSMSCLQMKDLARAREYGEDAIKILRMMAEPHPVEIATFLQELAEVYYASERRSEKGHKFSTEAIQLFEEALKLEPDNQTVTVNLAYSYSRLCWHYIFGGDLLKAKQACAKAEQLWERLPEKKYKTYLFFLQGKCLLLQRFQQKEEASATARAALQQELQPTTRAWFLSLLVKNGDKSQEQPLAATLAQIEKRLPSESFKNFKQLIDGMLADRPPPKSS